MVIKKTAACAMMLPIETGAYVSSPLGLSTVRRVFAELAKTKLEHTGAIHKRPPGRRRITYASALLNPTTPGCVCGHSLTCVAEPAVPFGHSLVTPVGLVMSSVRSVTPGSLRMSNGFACKFRRTAAL